MNEKFIYPLLAILLAVISTNVSATTTDPTTNKTLTFTWTGSFNPTNPNFNWKFITEGNLPYNASIPIKLKVIRDSEDNVNVTTELLEVFYIEPEDKINHVLNSIQANTNGNLTVNGLNTPAGWMDINLKNDLTGLDIATITINTQILNDFDPLILHSMSDGNTPRFPVAIDLKSKITAANYTNGALLKFTLPIIFSVNVLEKVSPNK